MPPPHQPRRRPAAASAPRRCGGGACVSRCDVSLLAGNGCRDGYVCASLPRHNDASVVHDVCVPSGFDGAPDNNAFTCTADDVPPTPNAQVVEPPGLDGCPSGM